MKNRSNTIKLIKARLSSKTSSGFYLILILLVLIAAAVVFGAIAEDVVTNDPLTILDVRFSVWLEHHSVPWLTRFMLLVTNIHSTLGVTVIVVAASAYLGFKRRWLWILTLVAAVYGGMLLNFLLKQVFMRQRPHFTKPLLLLTTYSFPSGHTLAATILYGTLCAFVVSRVRSFHWRGLTIGVASFLILLVGFSRIYLGAHYLSDVLAAMAEGLAWLAFCLLCVEELNRRRTGGSKQLG